MTPYTVVWHRDARDELAGLWLDAEDRNAVTLAAGTIDRHLATDASDAETPIPDVIPQDRKEVAHIKDSVPGRYSLPSDCRPGTRQAFPCAANACPLLSP
jgi:hypothetical protein